MSSTNRFLINTPKGLDLLPQAISHAWHSRLELHNMHILNYAHIFLSLSDEILHLPAQIHGAIQYDAYKLEH